MRMSFGIVYETFAAWVASVAEEADRRTALLKKTAMRMANSCLVKTFEAWRDLLRLAAEEREAAERADRERLAAEAKAEEERLEAAAKAQAEEAERIAAEEARRKAEVEAKQKADEERAAATLSGAPTPRSALRRKPASFDAPLAETAPEPAQAPSREVFHCGCGWGKNRKRGCRSG